MASTLFSLLLLSLSLLHQPPLSAANLHQTATLFRSQLLSDPTSAAIPPTTYFEVTKPSLLPQTKPYSYLALQHEFGFSYGRPCSRPPTPPSDQKFAKIILEWTATCRGRQFDRIFGIWLGGVEILRSCTAEPRATGIVWTVKKDITRYYCLLMNNNTLAVYLGNLVDTTYTGVYHVNVTFHYYPTEDVYNGKSNTASDLILPISRTLPLNDGLWFEIENSTDVESKEFKIPRNVYRAVLEVYISFHENDEFWFGNYPNVYIDLNNLTGVAGNGPFHEVVVSLDNVVVGAVWPFTVIYTGGVNPLLWRPITGIGSFDLPSYDIEITPFWVSYWMGKGISSAFSVTNALNVWYIDANLHLWLDKKSDTTQGELLEYIESPLSLSLLSNFTGFDGTFVTNVSRSITSSGWVKSSHGVVMTKSALSLEYSNEMVMGNDGNMQILNQVINFNTSVATNITSPLIYSTKSDRRFSLYLHSDNIDNGNGSYDSVADLALGVNEKREKTSISGVSVSRLKNVQNAQGNMLVKGNLVVSGIGSTQQEYLYTSDKTCYVRNVSSSNYTIVHDKESNTCRYQGWPFLGRTSFLGSTYNVEKKGLI